MRLAEIADGKVVNIYESQMQLFPLSETMIEITKCPNVEVGMDYNSETGEFTPVLSELLDEELAQAQILLAQQEIKAKQAEHDEVLALLLLGQQGV